MSVICRQAVAVASKAAAFRYAFIFASVRFLTQAVVSPTRCFRFFQGKAVALF